MEPPLLWWLHGSYGQRPNRNIRKMRSMLRMHLKPACCILWSTHRGMKFLDHGATEAFLAGSMGRMNYFMYKKCMEPTPRCLSGSITREDKVVAFYGRPIGVSNFLTMEPPRPCWLHDSYQSFMYKKCMEPTLPQWLHNP